MNRLKSFIKTSLLGGFLVVLPAALSIMVLSWLFRLITGTIQPLTDMLASRLMLPDPAADIAVLLLIMAACFLLGVTVRTRLGKYSFSVIETGLFKKIPGYGVIKETVQQLFSGGGGPFTRVAVVRLFGSDTRSIGFITDEHPDGSCTVFVPTGPNPTSGFIYHIKKEDVTRIDHPADDAMRTIISCGVGSRRILEKAAGR